MSEELKTDVYGHRKRMKQKFCEIGLNGWHDYEVLEMALYYAIPRRDTKPIAKKLMEKFKTINGVFNADIKELRMVNGVSEHTALFLKFLKDITLRLQEKKLYSVNVLSSPEDVYDYLKIAIGENEEEEFRALYLNTQNMLIAAESLQKGTINEAIVYPRKVVERALYHKAVGVIISHNHPTGVLSPSANDLKVTKLIRKALETVDIDLLDHIIVGKNDYYSFNLNGDM